MSVIAKNKMYAGTSSKTLFPHMKLQMHTKTCHFLLYQPDSKKHWTDTRNDRGLFSVVSFKPLKTGGSGKFGFLLRLCFSATIPNSRRTDRVWGHSDFQTTPLGNDIEKHFRKILIYERLLLSYTTFFTATRCRSAHITHFLYQRALLSCWLFFLVDSLLKTYNFCPTVFILTSSLI